MGASKCPKCGMVVHVPIKAWTMVPKRRRGALLSITLYECPKCLHRWREAVKLHTAH
ncbi:MAG: chorismate-binding protein [Candidatus Brockarchaeota archaeon]|nr:chorismate-binding protein [Candidatus Brockarchaeota archaeon]